MSTVPYIFANNTGNIPLSELDANFANCKSSVDYAAVAGEAVVATTAFNVSSPVQANITSVGTLTTLSVAGTITGANVIGNYFLGNGSQLTGIVSSYGNSNVADYLTVYTGDITGLIINASGNLIGSNVLTAGIVSATGNATASNLLTGGVVSVAGNVITDQMIKVSGNIPFPYTPSSTTYANNAIQSANTIIDIGETVYGNGIVIRNPNVLAITQLTDNQITTGNLTLTGDAVVYQNLEISNGNIAVGGLEIVIYPNYIEVTGDNTYSLSSTTSTNFLRANNTGYIATINMPANAVNGQITKFTVVGNAIQLSGGTGTVAPGIFGSFVPGSGKTYIYNIFTDTWYQTV